MAERGEIFRVGVPFQEEEVEVPVRPSEVSSLELHLCLEEVVHPSEIDPSEGLCLEEVHLEGLCLEEAHLDLKELTVSSLAVNVMPDPNVEELHLGLH